MNVVPERIFEAFNIPERSAQRLVVAIIN